MRKLISYFMIPFIMMLMLSCGSDKQKDSAEQQSGNEAARKKANTKDFSIPEDAVTTESGLKYVELKEGSGDQPQTGQKVVVHYTGWTMDGKKFDSSVDKGQPFSFTIGKGEVIAGWDEGISTMKEGGKRRLFIPSELAYGERGIPGVIPPNAMLVFDAELLSIE
ncbi:MAG: FKBP-type peptidyl-prolyl cis-trans isomerase [Caldithrix sp.]|nr:FKBP-type peptidyl-prolyl cis-trans isomerase [Caldithrix sp.]